MFTVLARVAEQYANHFNEQGLVNTAWAFAKVGHFDVHLFVVLASVAVRRLSDFNAQCLVNTAWAFATVSSGALRFRPGLARVATVGQLSMQLFAVLARAAERREGDLNAQDLANTA